MIPPLKLLAGPTRRYTTSTASVPRESTIGSTGAQELEMTEQRATSGHTAAPTTTGAQE